MRSYPALDLTWPAPLDDDRLGRILAEVDHERPTAVEPGDSRVRIFFGTAESRDRARTHLAAFDPSATTVSLDVSDDDWAARSQAALGPVRAGRFVIRPGDHAPIDTAGDDIVITIQPSMGFGTGHHASTRLCLELLQTIAVAGRRVLDVGTGSGILAIAASCLGASRAVALEVDVDALDAARRSVEINRAGNIELVHADLGGEVPSHLSSSFDVILANLTGATLVKLAVTLAGLAAPDARLIVSGVLTEEDARVRAALEGAGWTSALFLVEEEWTGRLFVGRSLQS